MKITTKRSVLVCAVLMLNVVLYGSGPEEVVGIIDALDNLSLGHESAGSLSFTARSIITNGSFVRCVICDSLCRPPEEDPEHEGATELIDAAPVVQCSLCEHQATGAIGFACGHRYKLTSCFSEESQEGCCPVCQLYSIVQRREDLSSADLKQVEDLLILCKRDLHYIVFPQGDAKRSLIHVAVDAGHVAVTLTIMYALLLRDAIPQGRLGYVVHEACAQKKELTFQGFHFSLAMIDYTGKELLLFVRNHLEQIRTYRQITGVCSTVKDVCAKLSSKLPLPSMLRSRKRLK